MREGETSADSYLANACSFLCSAERGRARRRVEVAASRPKRRERGWSQRARHCWFVGVECVLEIPSSYRPTSLDYNSESYKFYCQVFFAEKFRKLREITFPAGEERCEADGLGISKRFSRFVHAGTLVRFRAVGFGRQRAESPVRNSVKHSVRQTVSTLEFFRLFLSRRSTYNQTDECARTAVFYEIRSSLF